MNILLSNDDGFLAPGINRLREALMEVSNVTTVAPDQDCSGASNSLTLRNPLRMTQRAENFYSVNGTPTDCVHLGLGLYAQDPDIVISGINAGANLGDDVLYSGTVAAAMEGRFLGYPSLAVSLTAFHSTHLPVTHYASAVQAVLHLLPHLQAYPDRGSMILNVNVPDIPWEQIQGFRVTRLGSRHRSEAVIREVDPRGRDIFWIGPPGAAADAGEGTDYHAVAAGYVSITPIHSDMTRHRALAETARWLEGCDGKA
ncbi:MAG: 5'/3'-nucleotidase SurE [Thiothrix sp.]|uniref:5'/3'-nucleotidase SurE n=1 Tax=Thiothrix sp. TaxID=1032 RepID=UPI0026332F7F|nr:5'/3'-nucleotidase SurE [Thiothrix sp.]MDD5395104.1 5'/3'-nucleotidase SurE [Thiothrix sp.]